MANIFKLSDIDTFYTNILRDYLNSGFTVTSYKSSGRQCNEIMHINLTKPGSKIIRKIWLISNHESIHNERISETIILNVEDYDAKVGTLWLNEGTLVYSHKWWEFRNGVYTDSFEDFESAYKLKQQRCRDKYDHLDMLPITHKTFALDSIPTSFKERVLTKIQTNRGFKKATTSAIKNVHVYHDGDKRKCQVSYEFNGKSGCLVLG